MSQSCQTLRSLVKKVNVRQLVSNGKPQTQESNRNLINSEHHQEETNSIKTLKNTLNNLLATSNSKLSLDQYHNKDLVDPFQPKSSIKSCLWEQIWWQTKCPRWEQRTRPLPVTGTPCTKCSLITGVTLTLTSLSLMLIRLHKTPLVRGIKPRILRLLSLLLLIMP